MKIIGKVLLAVFVFFFVVSTLAFAQSPQDPDRSCLYAEELTEACLEKIGLSHRFETFKKVLALVLGEDEVLRDVTVQVSSGFENTFLAKEDFTTPTRTLVIQISIKYLEEIESDLVFEYQVTRHVCQVKLGHTPESVEQILLEGGNPIKDVERCVYYSVGEERLVDYVIAAEQIEVPRKELIAKIREILGISR